MVSKGVKGYLVKPFRAESITPLVEKMIEGIKKERT
jgi:YesN/AraC family two-component response regulator